MTASDPPSTVADEVTLLEHRLSSVDTTDPSPAALRDIREACERIAELTSRYPSVGHSVWERLSAVLGRELERSNTRSGSVFGTRRTSRRIQHAVLDTLDRLDPHELSRTVTDERGTLDPLIDPLSTTVSNASTRPLRMQAAGVTADVLVHTSVSLPAVDRLDPQSTAADAVELLTPIEYVAGEHRVLALLCLLAEEAPSALNGPIDGDVTRALREGPPTFRLWGVLLGRSSIGSAEDQQWAELHAETIRFEVLDLIDPSSAYTHPLDDPDEIATTLGRALGVIDRPPLPAIIDGLDDRIRTWSDRLTDAELPNSDRQRLARVRGRATAMGLRPLPTTALVDLLSIAGRQLRRSPDRHDELAWLLGLAASSDGRTEALERVRRATRTSTLSESGGRQLGAQVLGIYLAAIPDEYDGGLPDELRTRILADTDRVRWSLAAQALGDQYVYGDGDVEAAVDTLGSYVRRPVAPALLEQRPAAIELGVMITFGVATPADTVAGWLAPAVDRLAADIRRQADERVGRTPTTPARALGLLVAYGSDTPRATVSKLRDVATRGGVGDAVVGYAGDKEEAVGFAVACAEDRIDTPAVPQTPVLDLETDRRARMAAQALGIEHTHGDSTGSDDEDGHGGAFGVLTEELQPTPSARSPGASNHDNLAYLLGRLVVGRPQTTTAPPIAVLRRLVVEEVDPSSSPFARYLTCRALGTAVAAVDWADGDGFVTALGTWRRAADDLGYSTAASMAVGLVAVYGDGLVPSTFLDEFGTRFRDDEAPAWRRPGLVELVGVVAMDTESDVDGESPDAGDVVEHFVTTWDDVTITRRAARLFYRVVEARRLPADRVVTALEKALTDPVVELLDDESVGPVYWLVKSAATVSDRYDGRSDSLSSSLRTVLRLDGVGPETRLYAVEALRNLDDRRVALPSEDGGDGR